MQLWDQNELVVTGFANFGCRRMFFQQGFILPFLISAKEVCLTLCCIFHRLKSFFFRRTRFEPLGKALKILWFVFRILQKSSSVLLGPRLIFLHYHHLWVSCLQTHQYTNIQFYNCIHILFFFNLLFSLSEQPHFEPSPSGEITTVPQKHLPDDGVEEEHNWKSVGILIGEKLQSPVTRVRSASKKISEWIRSKWSPASAEDDHENDDDN